MAFSCTVLPKNGFNKFHCPPDIWVCEASHHDLKAVQEPQIQLSETTLCGDLAYREPIFREHLHLQYTRLHDPVKKPKGQDLSKIEKYHNRLVSKFRQPIESFFNWLNEKTSIQRAGKVRLRDALMIHCWGKLSFAFFLLVFNS